MVLKRDMHYGYIGFVEIESLRSLCGRYGIGRYINQTLGEGKK